MGEKGIKKCKKTYQYRTTLAATVHTPLTSTPATSKVFSNIFLGKSRIEPRAAGSEFANHNSYARIVTLLFHPHRSWVTVDTFEMVLIALNIIVFLAGIIGNSLVSLFSLCSYVKLDPATRSGYV